MLDKGGVINDGFIKEIDELRFLRKNSRSELAKIEAKEKNSTGINTLKIKYNKVFGYYLEVPKSQIKNVPAYFERRQTLVNAERYITEELKELEEKILTAEERLIKLETEIFEEVVKEVQKQADRIRHVARLLSRIDVLISFAEIAEANRYVKPVVTDSGLIKVIDARHPVVEKFSEEQFVPNDIFLNDTDSRFMIITGPNMAGKSTYIRMVGLIAIMAHIGSFIPAKSGEIGKIDRIFTRIGANDNLSQNESTFMVEMMETGNILNNATENSLIILDEIGRGTSTFDGVSIARAISEYILNNIKAKTLFATHYHELADIPLTNFGAKNLTIEVKEWNNEIIFLRKIIEGSTDKSYGIYVAKLAGLPNEVIERSYEILNELEKNEFGIDGIPKLAKKSKKREKLVQPILIFEENEAVSELRKIDINSITPLEALNILAKLKELADE
jgi:DNA mismatch repair protein MutS